MAATVSISEDALFEELQAFVVTLTGAETWRGLDNNVPMPKGPFVLITGVGLMPLAQPTSKYGGPAQTLDVSAPWQWSVGVDCYGAPAQDWAVILSSVLRTPYACDQFTNLEPFYASDAMQFPLVDGEEQYEERWRFDAVFQYTPTISLVQQSATSLVLGVKSVDATYPPGA